MQVPIHPYTHSRPHTYPILHVLHPLLPPLAPHKHKWILTYTQASLQSQCTREWVPLCRGGARWWSTGGMRCNPPPPPPVMSLSQCLEMKRKSVTERRQHEDIRYILVHIYFCSSAREMKKKSTGEGNKQRKYGRKVWRCRTWRKRKRIIKNRRKKQEDGNM